MATDIFGYKATLQSNMSGDGGTPREESEEVDFVLIKGRKRKIGETITAYWKGVYGKEKIFETFGADWREQKL